jgi:hypothetical protein
MVAVPARWMQTFSRSEGRSPGPGRRAAQHLAAPADVKGRDRAEPGGAEPALRAGLVAVRPVRDEPVEVPGERVAPLVTAEHLRYLERLADRAAKLPVGDPHADQVALGPLISQRQLDNVDRIVTATVAAGAELRAGGTHDQLFYTPTVLAGVTQEMPAFREEIFGPVAPVTVVKDDSEAIAVANDTEYGWWRPSRPDRGTAAGPWPTSSTPASCTSTTRH